MCNQCFNGGMEYVQSEDKRDKKRDGSAGIFIFSTTTQGMVSTCEIAILVFLAVAYRSRAYIQTASAPKACLS